MLAWLILVPVLGAVIAAVSGRAARDAPRWIALAALAVELALTVAIAVTAPGGRWLAHTHWRWIPQLGISFRLDLDGLSLVLILLAIGLTALAVAASWREIGERVGAFHSNLLFTLAGIVGVFLALDLFLFFFFWELMLVPMYFIIALWGHERRVYAAIKFFIFTQGSGLVMLVAILALALAHRRATGVLTFDYFALQGTALSPRIAFWIMLGFFFAFAVKLPAVPLHSWLPDAHTEAPTAGSVLLAGVLLKTGAYGLLRFVVPLFPQAAHAFAPIAMLLGAISVLYGALLAFAQRDMKRLVAYSSISHMGFVLLGVFAWTALSLQGVVVEMVAHGISTGALFIVVGMLQERLHTRDLARMGGLAAELPRLSALAMLFAIASLGLPGLGNFIGEFLILLGSFTVNRSLTIVASVGLVAAVIYALALVQRALHGQPHALRPAGAPLLDLGARETTVLAVLTAAIVWLGVYPRPLFDAAAGGLDHLQQGAPLIAVASPAPTPAPNSTPTPAPTLALTLALTRAERPR
ncbi:MAG TPA: NADH-quinone oxidoreductase subunit M [Steroidobacteraceae bacterium]|nr:NADH-quinone oxidoreductase subunit M [Steroidobacteraceae bacterium]